MFGLNWLLEESAGRARGLSELATKVQFALIVAVAVFMLTHTFLLVVHRAAYMLGIEDKTEGYCCSDGRKHTANKQQLQGGMGTEGFLADGAFGGPSTNQTTWTATDSDLHLYLDSSPDSVPVTKSKGSFTDTDLQQVAHGLRN